MRRVKTRTDNRSTRTILWILIGCVIVFIIAFALESVDFDYTKIGGALKDPETLRFIMGLFTSIAVGLLATAVYGLVNNREAQQVLDGIHAVGYDGLVESVINQISDYGGVCLPYYRLRIKMRPSPCGKYIRVVQEYEYRKVLPGTRTIHFRFKRLATEDENTQLASEPTLLSEDYKRYEFFFKLNDAQFYDKGISKEEIDAHYGVSDLRVDGHPVSVSAESGFEDTFVANLPAATDGSSERLLQYTVEYPIDWDDYIFILYEFPAKDIRVTFDFSDIKDIIYFHRVEFLGYELGFSADRGAENGIAEISHTGWLLPKSGVIAIWYLRDEHQSAKNAPPSQPAKAPVRRRFVSAKSKPSKSTTAKKDT